MKRALLIGTAAIALAATPAVAQVVDGDTDVTTDTEITTDIPETAMESGSDVTADIETQTDDFDYDADEELEAETDVDTEMGMGGEYYEDETDAEADADLNTDTEVEISRPEESDTTLDLETDLDTDVETDTELSEDGVGGEYFADEESATAGADLEADTEIQNEWNDDADVDTEADIDVETDTEVEMNEDGVGGPYIESRDQAINQLADLEGNADGEVSAEVEALDTDGLNDYVLNQIQRAGPEAVEDADELEADDLGY